MTFLEPIIAAVIGAAAAALALFLKKKCRCSSILKIRKYCTKSLQYY
jgi:uncharacterized membrane-anchored protein